MIAIVLAGALSAAVPETSATLPPPPEEKLRLAVGGHLGFPHLIGATALATSWRDDRPFGDLDFTWEPSGLLQSYSVGAAYRPLKNLLFTGVRARLLQTHAPWSRNFSFTGDQFFGLGLEAGVRPAISKGQVTVALQATWIPAQIAQLQWLVGLRAGFTWEVWERSLQN
jgi:hypothetical protein